MKTRHHINSNTKNRRGFIIHENEIVFTYLARGLAIRQSYIGYDYLSNKYLLV